jgi:hypothetical protein
MTSFKVHYFLLAIIAIPSGFLADSQANERSHTFERDFRAATSLRAKALKAEGANIVRLISKKKAVHFSGLTSNQRTVTEAFSKSLPVRFKTFDLEARHIARSGNSYVTAYLVR